MAVCMTFEQRLREDETEPKHSKFRDINFAGKFEHYWV